MWFLYTVRYDLQRTLTLRKPVLVKYNWRINQLDMTHWPFYAFAPVVARSNLPLFARTHNVRPYAFGAAYDV